MTCALALSVGKNTRAGVAVARRLGIPSRGCPVGGLDSTAAEVQPSIQASVAGTVDSQMALVPVADAAISTRRASGC